METKNVDKFQHTVQPLALPDKRYKYSHKDRGRKNRRALLAGNVKQLQESCLNEDLLLKI